MTDYSRGSNELDTKAIQIKLCAASLNSSGIHTITINQ
jgi:hypothetical protein